jgi:hypothetical protein
MWKSSWELKNNPRSKHFKYLLGKAIAAQTHPLDDLNDFLSEFGAVGDDEDKKGQAEVCGGIICICSHPNV